MEYVYTHILVVHLPFQSFDISDCHKVMQLAFWVEVASVKIAVHLFICTSRVN